MNKENFITSLKNTMELKKLIIDNPELPLLIFHCCYVMDNTTFLVTTAGREFNVRNVYFTREEAEKALKK